MYVSVRARGCLYPGAGTCPVATDVCFCGWKSSSVCGQWMGEYQVCAGLYAAIPTPTRQGTLGKHSQCRWMAGIDEST